MESNRIKGNVKMDEGKLCKIRKIKENRHNRLTKSGTSGRRKMKT